MLLRPPRFTRTIPLFPYTTLFRSRGLDVAEVHHPAAVGARLAGDMQLDHERMPVQPRAFVARRHVRQPVRGLDGEGLEDVHGRHSTAGFAPSMITPAPRAAAAPACAPRPSGSRTDRKSTRLNSSH